MTFEFLFTLALLSAPMDTVRMLAHDIGPRPACSAAESQAASFLASELIRLGYTVEVEEFPVLVGSRGQVTTLPHTRSKTSNVAKLQSAPSRNVIGRIGAPPYHLIGAHYDTKRNAPGADDNASGCAALLEMCERMTSARDGNPERNAPSIMIAFFGAEEGQTSRYDDHHFGSRFLARRISSADLLDMTCIDMVGMGPALCVRSKSPNDHARALIEAAKRIHAHASYLADNRGMSDHEAFEKRGVSAAWIERRPSPYYHSPRDIVVNEKYIDEAAQIMTEFLKNKN